MADEWDTEPTEAAVPVTRATRNAAPLKEASKESPKPSTYPAWQQPTPGRIKLEALILALAVIYIVNIFIGRRVNDTIATEWGRAFCSAEGIFGKNFTLVGAGQSPDPFPSPWSHPNEI